MRPILFAVLAAFTTVAAHADSVLKDIVSMPSVQVAMIINLRNPQARQQLNAALAKHPGSAEKVNRFFNCITHVAAVVLEEDGTQIGAIIAVGRFDKNMRLALQKEGLPAELMDEEGVCIALSVNGQQLSADQLREVAAAIRADGKSR